MIEHSSDTALGFTAGIAVAEPWASATARGPYSAEQFVLDSPTDVSSATPTRTLSRRYWTKAIETACGIVGLGADRGLYGFVGEMEQTHGRMGAEDDTAPGRDWGLVVTDAPQLQFALDVQVQPIRFPESLVRVTYPHPVGPTRPLERAHAELAVQPIYISLRGFPEISAEASSAETTAQHPAHSQDFQARMRRTLVGGINEWFEPGIESTVSRGVIELLLTHGSAFVDAIAPLVLDEDPSVEVVAEVIRTLGRVHHQPTRSERLTLLLTLLEHESYFIRDAALTGLAYANDTSVIPALQNILYRIGAPEFAEEINQLIIDIRS